MKRIQSFPLLLVLLAACMVFTACGGGGGGGGPAAPAPAYQESAQVDSFSPDIASDIAGLNGSGESVEMPTDSNRKIIRNAYLMLESKEFDRAVADLNKLINENGGYIESQNIGGQSLRSDGYSNREASIRARVPAQRLDAIIQATEGVCNVLSRDISSEDISDTYFDSEARLRSLAVQEERLLSILSQAERLEDIIELESALNDVRYQIETITGSIRRMDQHVSLSTLQFELSEVGTYAAPVAVPKSFGERVAASWDRSWNRVLIIGERLILWVIETLPSVAVFLLLPALLISLIAAFVRKHRKPFTRGGMPMPPLSSQGGAPASPQGGGAPSASSQGGGRPIPPSPLQKREPTQEGSGTRSGAQAAPAAPTAPTEQAAPAAQPEKKD